MPSGRLRQVSLSSFACSAQARLSGAALTLLKAWRVIRFCALVSGDLSPISSRKSPQIAALDGCRLDRNIKSTAASVMSGQTLQIIFSVRSHAMQRLLAVWPIHAFGAEQLLRWGGAG
jgi:hypothetical protein